MEQTNKNCLYLQSSQDLLLSWAVKSNERTFKIYVFSFVFNQTTWDMRSKKQSGPKPSSQRGDYLGF